MKNAEVIAKSLLTLLLCVAFTNLSRAALLSMLDAQKNGVLDLRLNSLGGASENCVAAKLNNRSSSVLDLILEPGRVLDNLDEGQQDIMVARAIKVRLKPNQVLDTMVYGFCCQSSNSGPVKGQKFELGQMGNATMQQLCNYLNTHDTKPYIAQRAIWTISDAHNLASIGMPNDTSITTLLKICNNGVLPVLPWVYIGYANVPSKVFSNETSRIVLVFSYVKKSDKELVIEVHDASGTKIKTLLARSYSNAGKKDFHFDIGVPNWKKGKYTVQVKEFEQEPFIKEFEI